jgi:predicted N-acetyltransferase YhbS
MHQELIIRPETPEDYNAITRTNEQAFGRVEEGKLVEALRQLEGFDPRLSLVAEQDGEIIGHILLNPVTIQADGVQYPSLSLGPIAVLPEYQHQGIGGRLVAAGHRAALELGYDSVILLGHPSYYPRFGYRMAKTWGLTNSWGINDEPFMAIELVEGSLEGKAGIVIYPDAFNEAT